MRFVIIASKRTGSSHLVNMVGAHPEILCNGNSFHPKNVWVFWPEADLTRDVKAELQNLRQTNPLGLLERIFSTSYGRPHVGFKIFKDQCDEVLQKVIEDGAVKKIILYRKNVLANFSSMLAAIKTGKFGVREGREVQEAPKVKFAHGRFIEFWKEYNAFYCDVIRRLNACRQPFHLINYDEINDPYLFSALINFIGADPLMEASMLEPRKKQVKQNSTDVCSRFSNPEDVMDFLRENDLLHWMHEGETSIGCLGMEPSLLDNSSNVQGAVQSADASAMEFSVPAGVMEIPHDTQKQTG